MFIKARIRPSRESVEEMLEILRQQNRARILYLNPDERGKPSTLSDEALIQEIFLELESAVYAMRDTDCYNKPPMDEESAKRKFDEFNWSDY